MRKISKTPLQRFEEKVLILPMTDCHLWTSDICCGYGRFSINGETKKAHRVAYEIYKGPIPEGMGVLHSCDNPICVNPDHLRVGTQKDNMVDRAIRGKHMITTPDMIRGIRERLSKGHRCTQIAKDNGISISYVSQIKRKKIRNAVW